MKRLALSASPAGSDRLRYHGQPLLHLDEIKAIEVELNPCDQVGDKSANLISVLLAYKTLDYKTLNVPSGNRPSLFGQKLSRSDTVPATPDQAYGNRGKKECDYLRHSA